MARPAKRIKREPKTPPAPARCFLLEIPIELRLQIFNYVLADVLEVTIAVAELEKNIFNSSEPKSTIEGIPGKYVPVVKNAYDPEMLNIGKLALVPACPILAEDVGATTSMDSGYGSFTNSMSSATTSFGRPTGPSTFPQLASLSLLLANKQLHAEMSAHIKHPKSSRSTIHVNYPYGIIALQKLYPSLVHHAERICISGWYNDSGYDTPAPLRNTVRHGPRLAGTTKSTRAIANAAIERLLRTAVGPLGHPTIKAIEFRIFYPRNSQFSVGWSCEGSPIIIGIGNTCGGQMELRTWKGHYGDGIVLNVKPRPEGRHITTSWRRYTGAKDQELESWKLFGNGKLWEAEVLEAQLWTVG